MRGSTKSDVELVNSARSRDVAAFAELVRRYQNLAFGTALALVHDFHAAQDVSQDAFLAAYSSLERLDKPEAFAGWLRSIVHNQARRLLRRRRRARTASLEKAREVESPQRRPDDVIAREEERQIVLRAIGELPAEQREVLAVYYLHERSQLQVARYLGLPVTTINNRLHAARAALKERMLNMVASALNDNKLPDDFAERIGQIIRVDGPVIDARFPRKGEPHILDSLTIVDGGIEGWVKVVQRSGNGIVRCVATTPVPGWRPGMKIANTPEIGHVKPMRREDFESAVRALTGPPPTEPRVMETGIKVIDLLCPLARGGTAGIFSLQGVGRIVLVEELFRRLKGAPAGVSLFCPTRRGDINAVQDMLTSEEGYPGDKVGKAQAFWLISDEATDPDHASTIDYFDAVLYLSPLLGMQHIWPAIDPLLSRSSLLIPAVVSNEHIALADRVRHTIRRARELLCDAKTWEYLAYGAARRAASRYAEFGARRIDQLSPEDRLLVSRAHKLQLFFSQRFLVAEPSSGVPGATVGFAETMRGCQLILDGGCDSVPDDRLRFIGSINDAFAGE